jgi:hypothetical protein
MSGAQPLRGVQQLPGAQHLPVAVGKVDAVLLADGWHKVALGSFTVGTLAFGDDDRGVPGYRFEEISDASLHASTTLAGPLDGVLAVRHVSSRRPLPQQQDAQGRAWPPNGHAMVRRHPPARLN